MVGTCFDHFFGIFNRADIAGVNAHFIYTLFNSFQGQFIIKVNICHQGGMNAFFDFAQGLRRLHIRHGYAVDFAAGIFQGIDLRGGGFGITRVSVTHALHTHRIART